MSVTRRLDVAFIKTYSSHEKYDLSRRSASHHGKSSLSYCRSPPSTMFAQTHSLDRKHRQPSNVFASAPPTTSRCDTRTCLRRKEHRSHRHRKYGRTHLDALLLFSVNTFSFGLRSISLRVASTCSQLEQWSRTIFPRLSCS